MKTIYLTAEKAIYVLKCDVYKARKKDLNNHMMAKHVETVSFVETNMKDYSEAKAQTVSCGIMQKKENHKDAENVSFDMTTSGIYDMPLRCKISKVVAIQN